VAFPNAPLTGILTALASDQRFTGIDEIRNILAHRLSGRRSQRFSSTKHEDGTHTVDWSEDTWHIPGSTADLNFDDQMLHRQLEDIAAMLKTLTIAAREFAESFRPTGVASA